MCYPNSISYQTQTRVLADQYWSGPNIPAGDKICNGHVKLTTPSIDGYCRDCPERTLWAAMFNDWQAKIDVFVVGIQQYIYQNDNQNVKINQSNYIQNYIVPHISA